MYKRQELLPRNSNSSPESNADVSTGIEDQVLPFSISGSDTDGTVVSFRINTLPSNGTLFSGASLADAVAVNDILPVEVDGVANLWFAPEQDWNGVTSFDFTAIDDKGLVDTTPATKTLELIAVNDGPVISTNNVSSGSVTPFINEIHYDNSGLDINEAVEIAGVAGTDLSGWVLYTYNGAHGDLLKTYQLSGLLPDLGDGFGAISVQTPGLQNGSPDGVALVDSSGSVVQFLSYEGFFTATEGPLAGVTSEDIGVIEPSDAVPGLSLIHI